MAVWWKSATRGELPGVLSLAGDWAVIPGRRI